MSGFLGGLGDRLRGREGTRWAGSVEDFLYDGETVRERVAVGDNRVVVTSHRLLAFTPTRGSENYREVDLPNVADVEAGHDGETHLLPQAARAFVYGAILLAVGVFVDFDGFVPTDAFGGTGEAAGRLGLGGLFAVVGQLLDVIARLDDVARAVGAVVVLFAVFVLAVYLLTRDRAVVVTVAGEAADVVVPVDGDTDASAAVADLEYVLFDAGTGPGESPGSDRDVSTPESGGSAATPSSERSPRRVEWPAAPLSVR